ncbi:tetratricopeptide repeat (TPR)-containing protein [Wolffia australiana]
MSGAARAKAARASSSLCDGLLPFGLPSPELIDPAIDPFIRAVDPIANLAASFRAYADAAPQELCAIHLEQRSLLRSLNDPKLLRRSLRSARLHATDIHHKIVLSAWLRYERREDELNSRNSSSCGPALECPQSALIHGYDPLFLSRPCSCLRPPAEEQRNSGKFKEEDREEDGDVVFCIGEEEIVCSRHSMAALSKPFSAMMYGEFMESRREKISFTNNGISADGMKAAELYSRTGSLDSFSPDTILELLSFSNKFCCEGLKSACDARLAAMAGTMEEALLLVDYGLEETAEKMVGSCLQVILRGLPSSLHNPKVGRLLCSGESRQKLAAAGHESFALYFFLSQVAMEEDPRSNTSVMLLERLAESAVSTRQKQLAFHQLGCVMLDRGEYEDAQRWFEEAAETGHVYSLAGLARAKYRRGNRYSAFKQLNELVLENDQLGWMHQERSLYCSSMEEKMTDLEEATRLDPTLVYPYKFRALMMMEDDKIGAAIAEINKILGFKPCTDCLELRAWFLIISEDYSSALRDVRALMTLDPDYLMFHGNVHGDHLVEMLQQKVQQWSLADCWMQLYDRWSSVDDIGSLAVVHQMLGKDPGSSVMWFRQSLLLLRLNNQKAAMRSLRKARNHSAHEHERLVYEGWILYDTGYHQEALAKAEESISIQRSFEAFFLKAYALADMDLDVSCSSQVVQLLEEALRCPSDGLRKGQALNNLGSVYVDCDLLDLAADCYVNALNIRHTRAHQGLARVYFLNNQRKAAYEEMTKLIEKAGNNASAYEKRSEYCDRDMAMADLSRATELDPLRTYPYRYRAAVLMDDHKEEEAIAELTRAIAFKPDLQLLHLRATFHESMGNANAAMLDCEAALCLDPSHAQTLKLYDRAREMVNGESRSTS